MKIGLLIRQIPLGLIRGYRYLISPLLPPSCRFTPTCSCYAIEAIKSHGTLRGLFLSCCRILRCHPFCQGGYDPVPPVDKDTAKCNESCNGSYTANNKTCDNHLGVSP
ncbi:MAG TPA: membrane protein insertion efficiency factor YidD [Desulfocapsa sulfexigens]|nr:membrane protein insertion efficiency factor YidD [Desulfocapsa sulfexigens]